MLNPFDAIEVIKKENIQIALIDWVLDETSGLEICNIIRKNFLNEYIYIIITGKKTKDDVVEALSKGADDYLIKPFNFGELKVRIKAGERILEYQHNLKNCFDQLYEASLRDSLTGTFNRQCILEKLEAEFERVKRLNNELSVIMSDIDYFKRINDSYGHLIGDEVLKHVGNILNKQIRKYDSVGRYGGEEFLIILPNSDIEKSLNVANRIKETLNKKPYHIGKLIIPVSMSFGISSALSANSSLELIRQADEALYMAKKSGKNRVVIYKNKKAG